MKDRRRIEKREKEKKKHTPKSGSPFTNTCLPLAPLTNGPTALNSFVSGSFSIRYASELTLFLNNLEVFFHFLNTNCVSVSCAATIDSLIFTCIGASIVHMNLVPILIPAAPKFNAAASPWPSQNPPDAMKGMERV